MCWQVMGEKNDSRGSLISQGTYAQAMEQYRTAGAELNGMIRGSGFPGVDATKRVVKSVVWASASRLRIASAGHVAPALTLC